MVNLSLKQRIPPLENGDRLTRYEFERRYQAMPRHQKAELIEGVVYLASPLRFESHAEPHGHTITWLGVYEASTPGVRLGIEPTVHLMIILASVYFLGNETGAFGCTIPNNPAKRII